MILRILRNGFGATGNNPWFPLDFGEQNSNVEYITQINIPNKGQFVKFNINALGNSLSEDLHIILRKNGNDAETIIITPTSTPSNGGQAFLSFPMTTKFNEGDLLNWKVVYNGTGSISITTGVIEIEI